MSPVAMVGVVPKSIVCVQTALGRPATGIETGVTAKTRSKFVPVSKVSASVPPFTPTVKLVAGWANVTSAVMTSVTDWPVVTGCE